MALYHLAMKNIGRSEGRSAVACASYRAGENLRSDELGKTFRFKREDRVAHTEIISPDYAPEWVSDRGQLWNSIEANEVRKNSRLAREFELGLPHELSLEQQKDLIRSWAKEQLTPLGLIADVAIHIRPDAGERNDHAHIMTTPRAIEPDGSWSKKKDRGLNTPEQLEQWRASWAMHANVALERAGQEARINHRSNKARGKPELPTIHVGYKHQAIVAKGGRSWRIEKNQEIRRTNLQILADIKRKAFAWISQKMAPDKVGMDLTPAAQTKKKEPAPPAPIITKTEPILPPLIPPPEPSDDKAEAEKRKKTPAQLAAWDSQRWNSQRGDHGR